MLNFLNMIPDNSNIENEVGIFEIELAINSKERTLAASDAKVLLERLEKISLNIAEQIARLREPVMDSRPIDEILNIIMDLSDRVGTLIQRLNEINNVPFNKKENVKADLEAFAAAAGLNTPLALPVRARVIVESSVGIFSFYEYLNAAGKALFGYDRFQVSSNMAQIRDRLLEIAGYKFMNADYFNNSGNVKADLEAFAAAANLDHPTDLFNNTRVHVKCSNGETVLLNEYLCRAGRALFDYDRFQAKSNLAQIKDRLLEIAGYELLNVDYFNNSENVKADLEAFAADAGLNTPLDLSVATKTNINCVNGQALLFKEYVYRAGKALFGYDRSQAKSNFAQIKDRLLEIAGYKFINAGYFNNSVNVKADLRAFANTLGMDVIKNLPMLDEERFIQCVKCSSGETLSFYEYLIEAGKALFGYVSDQSVNNFAKIRDKLFEIAQCRMDASLYGEPVIRNVDLIYPTPIATDPDTLL